MIREAVGPDIKIMLDVNQQWSIEKTLALWTELQTINPTWLEEPSHPDDVLGHRRLMDAGIPVAIGEAVPNRVVFKNYLQSKACRYVQVDPTKTGGVSECITVALMCKVYGIQVVPHVGCMGQISQHLVLFYHLGIGLPKVFLEHIPHLRGCFKHPAEVEDGFYRVPHHPGASSDIIKEVGNYNEFGLFDTVRHQHVQQGI
eukprot:m.264190 g.264190  ORF g.264190 m.264190 type:complete len:201 (-) comp16228_c0_seq50:1504-2106(-)